MELELGMGWMVCSKERRKVEQQLVRLLGKQMEKGKELELGKGRLGKELVELVMELGLVPELGEEWELEFPGS